MVLKLSKKVHFFLQFCADLSKKSKSIKAIYIYAYERSRYTFSGNDIVYHGMTQERNMETRQITSFFHLHFPL